MKNRDAKTSSFPKLILANEQGIIYNQIRNSQRVFAVSDGCHRKLN